MYCTEYPDISDVGAGRGTSYAKVVGGVELARHIKTYQNLKGLGRPQCIIYMYIIGMSCCASQTHPAL